MRRALALTGVAAIVSSAAWAAAEIPVRTTQLRELRPVASSEYLAWAQDSRLRPNVYTVFLQPTGGRAMRISRARKRGLPGGISGTTLVYQEYGGGKSDIRFYDLGHKRHVAVPKGVNTKQWEWAPSFSGDTLLFSRHDDRTERVYLQNIRNGSSLKLDSGSIVREGSRVVAGQVNGNFAVWVKCTTRLNCTVYRFDFTTKLTTSIAPPAGRVHYAPSVTPEGTVYLGRSQPRCGAEVEMWRYPIDGVPGKILSLPPGWDLAHTYAVSLGLKPPLDITRTEVYYDRGRCRGNRFDLYKLVDVVREPPPPPHQG
jgi:hypothetical protein